MSTATTLDGVLVVDKPTGPTSHDVVACVRRALRTKKVGHLGTLDPLATGVLPLAVGRATRLASLLTGAAKQYDAQIRLGLVTDSYDITGTVVGGAAAAGQGDGTPPLPEQIADALGRFVGAGEQLPPPVSAKKVGGVRAYVLARQQRPVQPKSVAVTLETLTVLSIDGWHLRCRLRCSSGYYVRSLAHDLGQRLGCGGCLEGLRRERHGAFGLADAVALDEVVPDAPDAASRGPMLVSRLIPLSALLPELPAVVVTDDGRRRTAHGNTLRTFELARGQISSAAARVRVLDTGGRLLAIAEPGPGQMLHPRVVLVDQAKQS